MTDLPPPGINRPGHQMTSAAIKTACLVLPLLLAPSLAEATGKDMVLSDSRGDETRKGGLIGSKSRHLRADDTIGDLLGHPAFAGFARLLLPWDGRRYDPAMRLSAIGSLLPYHSHVDPETVVGALNRMIDDVNSGHAVFYPFYSEGQKQEQPARENTGLFFFRGKPHAPFAVISPGGGFSYVGSVHEGFPYAAEISARGYNAFVLRYRAGSGGAVSSEDLAAALSYIFRNAGARRRHARLLALGQLGRRADGGRHRLARRCRPRRRHASQTVSRRAGLHRPFRSLVRRASDLRCGRRTGRNRAAGLDGKANCGPAQRGGRGGVPQVWKSRSWLRTRNRDQR